MHRLVRGVAATALVAAIVATVRGVLLRRNEARYGGPHTPYGPDRKEPVP